MDNLKHDLADKSEIRNPKLMMRWAMAFLIPNS
jgi:hypothetical protein